MNEKKNWDILNREQKDKIVRDIIGYFEAERDEQIGIFAAEDILDFFLEAIGKEAYNRGVYDAQQALKQRLEDLDMDLDLLQRK